MKPHDLHGMRVGPYEGTAPLIILRTSGNGYFVGQISGSFPPDDVDRKEKLASTLVSKLVTRGYVISAQSVLPHKDDGTAELIFTLTKPLTLAYTQPSNASAAALTRDDSTDGCTKTPKAANGSNSASPGATPRVHRRRTHGTSNGNGFLHATSSKELLLHGVDKELRPNANPSDEELTVLNVVREWITLREHSDAEGAANLSTSDIVVRTPLGAVRGLKRVQEGVYTHASGPIENTSELEATRADAGSGGAGVWVVKRLYTVVKKAGSDLRLLQEFLVTNESRETGKEPTPLIAEVCTTVVAS